MAFLKLKLHWQILIALALAVAVGLATGALGRMPDGTYAELHNSLLAVYTFVGKLFLNALKMIIVPLIASSIITGIAGAGFKGAFGRLGVKTITYYLFTSLIAILIGLVLVNTIAPGIQDGHSIKEAIGVTQEQTAAISAKVQGRDTGDLADVFLRMVPTNIFAAASDNGQMLGLIFFSLLFGIFMTRLAHPFADNLLTFWEGVFEVMMHITDWVLKFAPLGVFALVAKVVATTGLAAFEPLLVFFFTVLLALGIHFGIALPLLLRYLGGVNPARHYRAMAPALLMAFSTSSSSATLPVTLECAEKNAGVSNRTSSFVLPLGATVNMDGTALYECVAAMFIAQAYGLHLSFTTQFTVVLVALLTSIGVAGIPAASLVAISIILTTIGLPVEGIGLILAVDRLLDMCRTTVNVFSDSCGAVIIGRSEGETGILQEPEAVPAGARDV
jgi:proton glutamate symport protein